jgi:hypothetical protein
MADWNGVSWWQSRGRGEESTLTTRTLSTLKFLGLAGHTSMHACHDPPPHNLVSSLCARRFRAGPLEANEWGRGWEAVAAALELRGRET